MSYVAPSTRSDGYVVDASRWNQDVVNNTLAIKALVDASAVDTSVCAGRITLTSGTPVTTSDVTAATTLYFTPYRGNQIALYDGASAWALVSFTELSLAVPSTTSTMYDLFCYSNSGTATLEAVAWTNDTTRATALTTQNGVLVKSGSTTRRYLGSFRTTTVSGQTEDSATKRYVWNYYHRVRRSLLRNETTASWTYTTATWRQANASASNQVDVVVGVAEVMVSLKIHADASQTNAGAAIGIGIGQDSTSAPTNGWVGDMKFPVAGTAFLQLLAFADTYPTVGRHYFAWLEYSQAAGTTTWVGIDQVIGGSVDASGMTGWIEG